MKLFRGTKCPQCEALSKRVDLDQVPGLEVHRIPESGVPDSDAEAAALAEADFHGIQTVPALVIDGRAVHDVFAILDELQNTMAGATDGR